MIQGPLYDWTTVTSMNVHRFCFNLELSATLQGYFEVEILVSTCQAAYLERSTTSSKVGVPFPFIDETGTIGTHIEGSFWAPLG